MKTFAKHSPDTNLVSTFSIYLTPVGIYTFEFTNRRNSDWNALAERIPSEEFPGDPQDTFENYPQELEDALKELGFKPMDEFFRDHQVTSLNSQFRN